MLFSHETLLNNLNLKLPTSKPTPSWHEDYCPHTKITIAVEIHNENNILYCVMFETLTTLDNVCIRVYSNGELELRVNNQRLAQQCSTLHGLTHALHAFTPNLPTSLHEVVKRALNGYPWPSVSTNAQPTQRVA